MLVGFLDTWTTNCYLNIRVVFGTTPFLKGGIPYEIIEISVREPSPAIAVGKIAAASGIVDTAETHNGSQIFVSFLFKQRRNKLAGLFRGAGFIRKKLFAHLAEHIAVRRLFYQYVYVHAYNIAYCRIFFNRLAGFLKKA